MTRPVVVVEDDPFLRVIGVALDPSTPSERVSAFADFFSCDLPDFAGWLQKVRGEAGPLYPAEVRLVGTEAEYRQRIEASRAEAMKLAFAAKQAGAKEAEERTKAVDAEIGKTIAKAEAQIRKSVDKAMGELDSVAAEATRDLVAKLTGRAVTPEEAERAVKAVANG